MILYKNCSLGGLLLRLVASQLIGLIEHCLPFGCGGG